MAPDPIELPRRDLIVIGSSAGGVEALPRILQQLPPDLPASVCIVQHMLAGSPSQLVRILEHSARIPVEWAKQGARLEHGHVYVAPPNAHVLVAGDRLQLAVTARENHARPSIDKLFRSAAATHGSSVIGALLTGMLDDGVSGLRAIRDAGGVVIVQDPDDAAFPDLPARAILAIEPDRTLPIDGIGGALIALAGQPVVPKAVPAPVATEARMDQEGAVPPREMSTLGPQRPRSCPERGGPIWELGDERTRHYRYYLGHAASARDLLADTGVQIEAALWSAIRALNDRAATLEALAQDSRRLGNDVSADGYLDRSREAREQAELLRRFMTDELRA